jgi:hypothetical protein
LIREGFAVVTATLGAGAGDVKDLSGISSAPTGMTGARYLQITQLGAIGRGRGP